MSALRTFFIRNPKSPTLKGTIAPFVLVILAQLLFAIFSVYMLSAIRCWVMGENIWSKGHNYAVYSLSLYAEGGDENDFQRYKKAVDIPLIAMQARQTIVADKLDSRSATLALAKIGNFPDDIPSMIWSFRNFKDISFFRDAIDQWVATDALILKLDHLAGTIHSDMSLSTRQRAATDWLEQIKAISMEISPHAVAFSRSVGDAARLVERSLMIVNLALAAILAALTTVRVRRFLAQRRSIENTLAWQASHDPLTGIANRRAFEQRLEEASRMTAPPSLALATALMFIDLDQFKIINDTCGHAAGDALLRRICAPLQSKLGDGDLLARLGGDEFSVLMADCTLTSAVEVANAMRADVEALDFVWGLRAFKVTASIGLAHSDQGLGTAEDLMRAADMACYMAKEKGRNRVHIHRAEDQDLLRHAGDMNWVQRIHQALNENRFCLYAQDIAPLGAENEGGMHLEILIRLRDETGALIPPASFLPAAERFGQMTLIDRWVVRQAFAMLVERKGDPTAEPVACCAINLSGATIGDDAFLGFLVEAFAEFDVPPRIICFEITETSAITNLEAAQAFIKNLRAIGCRFSLDDFGAGMSSFAYLKHFPVDFLKIDGGFVKNLLEDKVDRAMVEMINHIGHVMGKRVIAEFVENDGLIAALGTMGVDYGQGYGIGRPRPFDRSFRSASWVNDATAMRKVA